MHAAALLDGVQEREQGRGAHGAGGRHQTGGVLVTKTVGQWAERGEHEVDGDLVELGVRVGAEEGPREVDGRACDAREDAWCEAQRAQCEALADGEGDGEAVEAHHGLVRVVFRRGAGGVGGEQRAGRLAQTEEEERDVALRAAASCGVEHDALAPVVG